MKESQPSGVRITRRSLLCGALTTATVAISSMVSAQEMQKYLPPRVQPKPKGPLVFLDYDKEEIRSGVRSSTLGSECTGNQQAQRREKRDGDSSSG
jgi:hypothetical protein